MKLADELSPHEELCRLASDLLIAEQDAGRSVAPALWAAIAAKWRWMADRRRNRALPEVNSERSRANKHADEALARARMDAHSAWADKYAAMQNATWYADGGNMPRKSAPAPEITAAERAAAAAYHAAEI